MNWKGRQTTYRRFKSQITNLNSLEAKLPTAGLNHKSPIQIHKMSQSLENVTFLF